MRKPCERNPKVSAYVQCPSMECRSPLLEEKGSAQARKICEEKQISRSSKG